MKTSRRQFLRATAAGGAALAVLRVPLRALPAAPPVRFAPNQWVRIDASGRVTLATDTPPNVPRPVLGVSVTVEPAPGSPAPTGAVVLARVQ